MVSTFTTLVTSLIMFSRQLTLAKRFGMVQLNQIFPYRKKASFRKVARSLCLIALDYNDILCDLMVYWAIPRQPLLL